ncbi:MAG: segregation and condensation protein A [Coxiella sp. RIFCSPHIGHO2_12_FULL_42_15]|nr:MAG: segregation and condensation protein A [Coxiella sp. RIFCSPHIGHO2_12_FULL_42_15]
MQTQADTLSHKEVRIKGEILAELPQDLYIPPDALRIFLEAFEGPLDLLLYLIKKHNLDILDIPIADITHQYMQYVELMQELQLELAAEYLLMAAMLAEIKSRMLLPHSQPDEGLEEDPRVELIRRLQEYERFQKAAQALDALPRAERDYYVAQAMAPVFEVEEIHPGVALVDVLDALKEVMQRAKLYSRHYVEREPLSIRERMSHVLATITHEQFTAFTSLFKVEEGRMGVVVTLIALLELIRQSLLELVQSAPYAPIYVKAKG